MRYHGQAEMVNITFYVGMHYFHYLIFFSFFLFFSSSYFYFFSSFCFLTSSRSSWFLHWLWERFWNQRGLFLRNRVKQCKRSARWTKLSLSGAEARWANRCHPTPRGRKFYLFIISKRKYSSNIINGTMWHDRYIGSLVKQFCSYLWVKRSTPRQLNNFFLNF